MDDNIIEFKKKVVEVIDLENNEELYQHFHDSSVFTFEVFLACLKSKEIEMSDAQALTVLHNRIITFMDLIFGKEHLIPFLEEHLRRIRLNDNQEL